MRRLRRGAVLTAADVGVVARVLLIGISGGLSVEAALRLIAEEIDGQVRTEVRDLLRRARLGGLVSALIATEGPLRPLATTLARAQASGAPMTQTVSRFVDEQTSVERSEIMLRLKRLPVKLLVPLTLLVLPGFVVLVVGPSFMSALSRLLGPLIGL